MLLLLISTSGVIVNKHYSGGKLFSSAMFIDADSCCEIQCGCCDETTENIKVENDFLASSFELAAVSSLDLFSSLIIDFIFSSESADNSMINAFLRIPNPPKISAVLSCLQVYRL